MRRRGLPTAMRWLGLALLLGAPLPAGGEPAAPVGAGEPVSAREAAALVEDATGDPARGPEAAADAVASDAAEGIPAAGPAAVAEAAPAGGDRGLDSTTGALDGDAGSMASAGSRVRFPRLRFDPFAPASAAPAAPGEERLLAAAEAAWAPQLRATLVAGPRSLADLGGRVLAIGEEAGGYRLLEVREFEAVFEHGGVRVTLPVAERRAP